MELNRTFLHDWHLEHNARMVEFSGWEMPLNYPLGARKEHLLVRQSCGLFDISHMGRFLIETPNSQSLALYESLISSPVQALEVGRGCYGLVCREDGGILDDVFNFRLDDGLYLLVVNAANRQKVLSWFHSRTPGLTVHDMTSDLGMIALQGPRAMELLRASGFEQQSEQLHQRNRISQGELLNDGIFTSTGYTGEDGVEIYATNTRLKEYWQRFLMHASVRGIDCGPVGLAARDSLRFEPGFPLYGHELSEELTPREVLLKWACKLSPGAPDFIGKKAIQDRYSDSTSGYRLKTVQMLDKAMPRQNMKVMDYEGNECGYVASGMASPSFKEFFANIFIISERFTVGDTLFLDVRGKRKACKIIKRPIYKTEN